MRPLAERFWEKVGIAEADDCWPWLGSRNPAGYGQIFVATGKAPKKAHRVAWELLRGEIPDGLHLNHLCRVRHCVNPWHCDPVTNEINIARGKFREWRRPKATHCVSGHEFTEANTYVRADGERNCRTCANERARRKRQERAA